MPINTNLPPQAGSSRDRFKREISLLSGGFSCREAFPEGKLTVFPWTSKTDEFLLARSRRGNKDTALYDLIPQLCDLNGCPEGKFVSGEVYLVLLVARSISRQNRLSFDIRCPVCDHRMVEEVAVPDALERIGEKKLDYPGYDDIVLPETQDVVRLRPLLIEDEIAIANRTIKDVGEVVARTLTSIMTVGGGKPDNIIELRNWIDRLSPADAEFLAGKQRALTPHLSMVLHVTCEDAEGKGCGEEFQYPIQLDQKFFRPAGGG